MRRLEQRLFALSIRALTASPLARLIAAVPFLALRLLINAKGQVARFARPALFLVVVIAGAFAFTLFIICTRGFFSAIP